MAEAPYRECPQCDKVIDPEWATPNQRFCSISCKNRWHYIMNLRSYHQKRYDKKKRQWERSQNGKKADIPIRVWLKLPEDWR